MATMQVEYINPFIKSLQNTFEMMLGCQAKRSTMSVKKNNIASFPISGIIGLSGNATGAVIVSLSKEVALKSASAMLMMEMTEVDEDVRDAVGEMANMVAGAAKAELEEFQLQVSLPNVVTGENHTIHFPSNVTPICIFFDTEWGQLALEIGFSG